MVFGFVICLCYYLNNFFGILFLIKNLKNNLDNN